ncbi:hypothetical protein H4582DRAFT_2051189 [Lactarius indigo]|nr:hypothetical protein H4582DRAFT_2051189 [Lactarius indigo]
MQVVYQMEDQMCSALCGIAGDSQFVQEEALTHANGPAEDVIERLNEVSRSQKVFNTAIRDFIYNTDTMLRALCTQGQGNVNLASLGLRLPTVPLFSTSEPVTPGLGLGRMMIDSLGVSGPSRHHGEPEDGESSRPGLRRRIAHSAPSSKAQSRAGSRQSSWGHK